jgi:hypothetical protein
VAGAAGLGQQIASWEALLPRFCRIPLDGRVPRSTTLIKLVRLAAPEVFEQLNTALVGKLAEDKLLRGRIITPVPSWPPARGGGRSAPRRDRRTSRPEEAADRSTRTEPARVCQQPPP